MVLLVKVKTHSNDQLNDKVDALAKATTTSASRLLINYTNLPDLRLLIICDHLSIEAFSCKCIKQLHYAKNFNQLLHLNRNDQILTLTKDHHINWAATSFMLNYNYTEKDSASTLFKQHHIRVFKYKLFSNELLILIHLKQ